MSTDNKTLNFDISQLFSTMSSAIAKDVFSPIKQIYIDWSYIQDIYLGALVARCKTPEEYQYVLSCIPKYNDRLLRSHSRYFPKLNTTDIELEEFMKDPNNSLSLLYMSPMTNMFENVSNLIKSSITRNLKLSELTEQLVLLINLYPLVLTDKITSTIKHMIHTITTNIKIGITSLPINQIDINLLLNSDILLIDRLDIFLSENSPTMDAFYADPVSKFLDCAVISPKIIDNQEFINSLPTLSEEQIEQNFNITEQICNLSASFKFINPIIFTDQQG